VVGEGSHAATIEINTIQEFANLPSRGIVR